MKSDEQSGSTPPSGEVFLYEAPDGQVRVDVRLVQETVWLTQEQLSQLFGRERSVITKHVWNVFREGELDPVSECAKFAHTAADGKTYEVDHYNLDMIISVGYRGKSKSGTGALRHAPPLRIRSNIITDTSNHCPPRLTHKTLDGDAMREVSGRYQFFIFTF